MPVVTLGLGGSALLARLTRASLLQVIREDYIRTARAKGLAERVVVVRHALRNSLIPVATCWAILCRDRHGHLCGRVDLWHPGMGKYFVTSISNRDYR